MSIRRCRALGLALAAVAACLVPALSRAETGTDDLILKTEPPGLFLLYSGDVIGYIEPCG